VGAIVPEPDATEAQDMVHLRSSNNGAARREQVSAEGIADLIRESTSVVPGLEDVSIKVVRLPIADKDGCNWVAKHSALPAACPPESPRILLDVIANGRRQFNLWDVH
jgi:hypothetical protein